MKKGGRNRPPFLVAENMLCGASQDGLGAVGAAAGVDGNLAEAFGTFLGGGIGRGFAAMHARDQSVYGSDYKEVDRSGNQEEPDAGIDEVTDRESRAAN